MSEAFALDDARRIHIVGAGGAGMSGLAKILAGLGHEVTGSDLKPGRFLDTLGDLGLDIWVGHAPDRVVGSDLVVSSSAVPDADPELSAARAAGIEVWSRPRLLDAVTAAMPAIGFTGTHGKTSSTALAITALRDAGHDPSFLVGGEMVALNTGAHLGVDSEFILEADEAFGTFRHLHLVGLQITNVEPDHLDFYGDLATLEDAFAQVALRVDGPVVGCFDDPGVRRVAERTTIISYGTGAGSRWRISGIDQKAGHVAFHLSGPDAEVDVDIPRPGVHMARNAAGVIALLAELGHDPAGVAAGMRRFAGVRRRFEVRGRLGGITVVDDYAHHPTEVAATIAAGRAGGWDRVWAVFQPHRYSRTAELGPSFGAPLASADRVIVTDVYAADEVPRPGVSGRIVAEAVSAAGGSVEYVPALHDIPSYFSGELRPGDLVLLLGAGDISSIADELLTAIGRAR